MPGTTTEKEDQHSICAVNYSSLGILLLPMIAVAGDIPASLQSVLLSEQ